MSTVQRNLTTRQSNYNLFDIYWTGGGEVPDALKGEFTSMGAARLALEAFYVQKEANVKAPSFKYKKQPSKKTKESNNA